MSNKKCPAINCRGFDAVSICDRKQDEIIVFGYIREETMKYKDDEIYLPQYLIKIMHTYYQNEIIHLFEVFYGRHWTIDVFDILS